MNANLLKMMKEKLNKGKQETQPIQQQNANTGENNVQKVQKQKLQQQAAIVNVQAKIQPVQQKASEQPNQNNSPKKTLAIIKNTPLHEKLMSLRGKLMKKDESQVEQKQNQNIQVVTSQKPALQISREPKNQNSQQIKPEVKSKQLSLKLLMQKLKMSKSEQNQVVQKPQQSQLVFKQTENQEQLNIVELNSKQLEKAQALGQQQIMKSSSALDQGEKFPWAKSVNIPVRQSNQNNQFGGKSQNSVEQILEIIKKTSEQQLVQNFEQVDKSQPNNQQEEHVYNAPLVQQQKIIENQQQQKNFELQEQKPQQRMQSIQTQTAQKQEKQKSGDSKVMQKLNTMLQKMKKMKEMKQNKNKQPDQVVKAVTLAVQNNIKRNETQQINQVINVSKAEENIADQQDQQQQQNFQEEDQSEEEVNEQQLKMLSKQQQKRNKIFIKQMIKIGEITQKIRTLISQKYQSHQKIYPSQSTGLVDLFRKIQLAIEK